MPCLSSLCFAFALGVLFARAHRETLAQKDQPLQAPGAWLVAAFGALFWGPATGYLMLVEPAWSVSYWTDPANLPMAFGPLLVLSYAIAPMLGYLAAANAAMTSRNHRLLWLLGLSVGITVVLVLAGLPRLLVVGSYRQYQQGFGLEPLAGSSLGLTLVWSALVYALVVAWTQSRLRGPLQTHLRPFLPPKG